VTLRVLLGCECSGVVRRAFRALGHDAWSCDILPAEDGSEFHYQCDVSRVLTFDWDVGIFFPPCTYLCRSGRRWLFEANSATPPLKGVPRWKAMHEGAALFRACLNAPIAHVGVENPRMHEFAIALVGGHADQYVQPWWFGEKEIKETGFRLRGLAKLAPSNIVGPPPKDPEARKSWARVHRMTPAVEDRGHERSRFLPGVAEAMALQWGGLIEAHEHAA
jgi:hypothetical protein